MEQSKIKTILNDQIFKSYMKLYGYEHSYLETIISKLGMEHFSSYKETAEYYYKNYYELLKEFGGAADTCPELNMGLNRLMEVYSAEDFSEMDFDITIGLQDYAYSELRQAIKYYTRSLYIRDRLDKFYENSVCY